MNLDNEAAFGHQEYEDMLVSEYFSKKYKKVNQTFMKNFSLPSNIHSNFINIICLSLTY